MTRKYLALGKLLVAVLALGTPLLLYQGFRNHRELVLRDAALKATLSEERDLMVRQMVSGFFKNARFTANPSLKRRLPDGPLQGLPPFPESAAFARVAAVELVEESQVESRFLGYLRDGGRFASGMPKRFAGMVELLRGRPLSLSTADYRRLYQVTAEFWMGGSLPNDELAFLIQKLPQSMETLFEHQSIFLGLTHVPLDHYFWVTVEEGGYQYLLAPGHQDLDELNRILAAFDYDLRFYISDCWSDWGEARLTIDSESLTPDGHLRESRLAYLGMGTATELVILLIFGVLTRYEKVNRTQKRLLATTSHELRTPLAVMRQFSEMLIDRADRFEPRYQTYHQHIHRECMKMQLLVENLLSAARIENFTQRPTLQTLALKPWLEEIVQSVSRLEGCGNIHSRCPELEVRWDPAMMSQVLVNLLENARLHAGTDIELRVAGDRQRVILSVRDFGNGADLKKLARIEAFNNEARPHHGLGLGLYLSYQIVRAHGGHIEFENARPGLRVILRLPLDAHGASEDPP